MSEDGRQLTLDVVERLRLRAHRSARAQYLSGKKDHAKHLLLGVPATALTAVIGTAIFASLDTDTDPKWVVIAGIVAATAALMSALQTFFGFGDRSAKHRQAGAHFAALKRDLDVLRLGLGSNVVSVAAAQEVLQTHAERFGDIEQASPDVSDRLYDRAKQEQTRDTEGI